MEIEISNEDSDYMYNFIEKIIEECGPRMPGSPQEAKSAEIIKEELAKTCDEVVIEPFTLHPRANLGWINIALILTLLSFGLFFQFEQLHGPIQIHEAKGHILSLSLIVRDPDNASDGGKTLGRKVPQVNRHLVRLLGQFVIDHQNLFLGVVGDQLSLDHPLGRFIATCKKDRNYRKGNAYQHTSGHVIPPLLMLFLPVSPWRHPEPSG